MVTKAKQAPVADSTNGTLLDFQDPCCHCCHLPAPADASPPALGRQVDEEDTVGPLVLTLGSAAADDHAVPRLCNCSRDAVPVPAPVMISVLRGSRYLRPAQELLREAVSVGGQAVDGSARGSGDDARKRGHLEAGDANQEMHLHGKNDGGGGGGVHAKLLSLLNELESRQEHYFQELDRVASSFEPVLGAAATAGYTSLMAQAMSRHFGNLRRTILRKLRLHAARRPASLSAALLADEEGDGSDGDEEDDGDAAQPVTEEMVNRLVRRKKQAAAAEQVWRPLRGLPEDSVAILRAWLFDHFLNPYPSDNEKLRLAVSTGLSRSQISNWFINARVRLWKPMVKEMYNTTSSLRIPSPSPAPPRLPRSLHFVVRFLQNSREPNLPRI